MPKKRRKAKTAKFSDRMIIGISGAVVSAVALLAIFAVVITKGILDLDASNWIVIVVNIISAMICGILVSRKGEGNIIKCGLLPGIIYGFIITVFSLIINIEAFSITESLKILLISAAGSTTGSIVSLCTSNKKYHK